jgi:hypothetical protein
LFQLAVSYVNFDQALEKGFLFQFCDIAILAIVHKEELAKFGYRSKRKVEKFKKPAIFWWPARTYMLVISELFSFEI